MSKDSKSIKINCWDFISEKLDHSAWQLTNRIGSPYVLYTLPTFLTISTSRSLINMILFYFSGTELQSSLETLQWRILTIIWVEDIRISVMCTQTALVIAIYPEVSGCMHKDNIAVERSNFHVQYYLKFYWDPIFWNHLYS